MANINAIGLVVLAAATPSVLGTNKQRFKGVVFFGGKGTPEENNASTAYVQLRSMSSDGTAGAFISAMPVPAGGYSAGLNLDGDNERWFDASQFTIKVGSNSDGVVAILQS
jgi:hypothetical protein